MFSSATMAEGSVPTLAASMPDVHASNFSFTAVDELVADSLYGRSSTAASRTMGTSQVSDLNPFIYIGTESPRPATSTCTTSCLLRAAHSPDK